MDDPLNGFSGYVKAKVKLAKPGENLDETVEAILLVSRRVKELKSGRRVYPKGSISCLEVADRVWASYGHSSYDPESKEFDVESWRLVIVEVMGNATIDPVTDRWQLMPR